MKRQRNFDSLKRLVRRCLCACGFHRAETLSIVTPVVLHRVDGRVQRWIAPVSTTQCRHCFTVLDVDISNVERPPNTSRLASSQQSKPEASS